MIFRICNECGEEVPFQIQEPANLSCQRCGSPYQRFNKSIKLCCTECQSIAKPIEVDRGDVFFAVCNTCGKNTWVSHNVLIEGDKKKVLIDIDITPNTLKIVIPYYSGGALVERAVNTWLIPEVVFALTDPAIIPPGSGICSQFFTPVNCHGLKLADKKKEPRLPIANDLFENMLKLFPETEYFGYFNSDIILPPGKSVYNLLPTKDRLAVFHHRLEVQGKLTTKAKDLRPHNVIVVGKDGFILSSKLVKDLVENFPPMIIGRPFWDTALALWLWERHGREKIDFAYREVWHVPHKSVNQTYGEYELPGSKWNAKMASKIFKKDRGGDIWKDICSEALNSRKDLREKKIGIIQPGRVGDIIIVLPIAKWFYDQGYEVIWPVYKGFAEIFDSVDYVNPILIDKLEGAYHESKEIIKKEGVQATYDLAIGFGADEKPWRDSGLSFDEWKYQEAGVPIFEKYKLKLTRNLKAEKRLMELFNLGEYEDGYVVTNSDSSFAHFDFNIPDAIEVEQINEFTIVDWCGVIDNARYVYCVDSAVANLINQLGLAKDRRYIKTWHDIRDSGEADRLTPNLFSWKRAAFAKHDGEKYPNYINDGNAMSHIVNRASKWCKGVGLDIGGGAHPLPGAEKVDLDKVDLNKDGVKIKAGQDYIFSSHCLEHLKKPAEVISQLSLVLKPGGILFLYLPHPYITYWHPGAPAVTGEYGHKHILDPNEVKIWVEKAGLKVLEMTSEPDHYYSYYIVASKGTKKRKKAQETATRAKRKLKIATVTIAYNAMPFIEHCLSAVRQFADQIIVVEGIVKDLYETGEFNLESNDGTIDCVFTKCYKELFLGDLVAFDHRCSNEPYKDKMEMQNHALEGVDADYVWLIDSDEFYLQKDVKQIIKFLEDKKPAQVNFPIVNFFKTPRWRVTSEGKMFRQLTREVHRIFKMKEGLRFTSHQPPTVYPKTHYIVLYDKAKIYHFPYCFNKQVELKAALYSQWDSHTNIKDWFNSFFVNWSEENRKELEDHWGAWAPDQSSRTVRYTGIVPKAVKPIFKGVEGVKWEK